MGSVPSKGVSSGLWPNHTETAYRNLGKNVPEGPASSEVLRPESRRKQERVTGSTERLWKESLREFPPWVRAEFIHVIWTLKA